MCAVGPTKQAAQAVGGGGEGGGSAASGDGRAGDTLVLLDTMLVSSYMQCSPPRHSALVRLGFCHEPKSKWLVAIA